MNIVMLESIGLSKGKTEALAKEIIEAGHNFTAYYERSKNTDELKDRVKYADILLLANMPLPGEVIRAAENLKMISVAFTGIDHIDLKVCKEKNIMICNAAGYSTHAVAELAFGLMLSVIRNIIPLDAAVRKGGTKMGYSQNELFGKTLGIIGTGAIGLKTAQIASAFGMRVLAYSRTQKAEAVSRGIRYVELDELLSQSDIVSLHVPLNAETKNLINEQKLSIMKKSAILINTARGPVVDSQALAEALKNGSIAGAGIDVYEVEPPVSLEHPFFSTPNTVVTPHIAFAAEEAILRRAVIVFDNINLYLKGVPQNVAELK